MNVRSYYYCRKEECALRRWYLLKYSNIHLFIDPEDTFLFSKGCTIYEAELHVSFLTESSRAFRKS
jgi:hypothetical protein